MQPNRQFTPISLLNVPIMITDLFQSWLFLSCLFPRCHLSTFEARNRGVSLHRLFWMITMSASRSIISCLGLCPLYLLLCPWSALDLPCIWRPAETERSTSECNVISIFRSDQHVLDTCHDSVLLFPDDRHPYSSTSIGNVISIVICLYLRVQTCNFTPLETCRVEAARGARALLPCSFQRHIGTLLLHRDYRFFTKKTATAADCVNNTVHGKSTRSLTWSNPHCLKGLWVYRNTPVT